MSEIFSGDIETVDLPYPYYKDIAPNVRLHIAANRIITIQHAGCGTVLSIGQDDVLWNTLRALFLRTPGDSE
jgi:hypothetical protein